MPFGWEPDADGLRGHVFVTNNNDTVVVSIKGTSAGAFGGGGPTVGNDKLNDNLLFRYAPLTITYQYNDQL